MPIMISTMDQIFICPGAKIKLQSLEDDERTYGRTRVGARDPCTSKNILYQTVLFCGFFHIHILSVYDIIDHEGKR